MAESVTKERASGLVFCHLVQMVRKKPRLAFKRQRKQDQLIEEQSQKTQTIVPYECPFKVRNKVIKTLCTNKILVKDFAKITEMNMYKNRLNLGLNSTRTSNLYVFASGSGTNFACFM